MKSRLEEIYLHCPVILQNIILSMYGLKLNRIRHGILYKKCLEDIQGNLNFTQEKIDNYQLIMLKALLEDCFLHVPYYRDVFKKKGIGLGDFRCIDHIRKMPLLDKEILRKNASKFYNERFNKHRLHSIHTTGTTGTPLKILCDSAARQKNYAFYHRFLSLAGINYLGRKATLGGRIVVSPKQKKPPFWRINTVQKNLLFSSYHLTERNLEFYIKKLKDFKPDYIDAYPSSIYIIAKYIKENGIDGKGITKNITTSAETLFPEQRKIIEQAFGVKVFDQYGSAEMAVFVGQCKEGHYHIHSDYGIVEFINDDGKIADFGEEAEIVCTSFINPVMPLIRYRIGDRAKITNKKCRCGLNFPIIEALMGRKDDIIITPDGHKIGRLSPVIKGFPVQETQYIQTEKESVTVKIVKAPEYTKHTENLILNELRKRLGNSIKINFEYCNSIPRGRGGKLKTVISKI